MKMTNPEVIRRFRMTDSKFGRGRLAITKGKDTKFKNGDVVYFVVADDESYLESTKDFGAWKKSVLVQKETCGSMNIGHYKEVEISKEDFKLEFDSAMQKRMTEWAEEHPEILYARPVEEEVK